MKGKTAMKRILAMASAAMLVPLMSSAADYPFIISGDPVAAATANSCAAVSSSTALATGTLSSLTSSSALEARYRTWYESGGTALRSDKAGMKIVVK